MTKNFFITGPPGSGKTTLLMEIVKKLREKGIVVDGITCPEIRIGGIRRGFKIITLKDGKEGILAMKNASWVGPSVGKYIVNLNDLDEIGTKTLQNALLSDEIKVIVIDEIGIMELKSQKFQKVVKQVLDSQKIVLGIIHQKSKHPLLQHIRNREDTKIFEINRNTPKSKRIELVKMIQEEVLKRLGKNS